LVVPIDLKFTLRDTAILLESKADYNL
jgi:hypothetical protein